MNRFVVIVILVITSLAPIRGEQLPIRTYTTADGLARDRIYQIISDPRGYLWFCTYDGLSRFDGYEFTNYSIAHGLPHRVVYDLLITRSGDYWAGTSAGLARLDPLAANSDSKFKPYMPTERRGSEAITALYEDNSGTVWAGTGNGLHRLRKTDSDWQIEYVSLSEKPEEHLNITSIVEGPYGVLWIGAEQGLFRYARDGKVDRFTDKDGLPHSHVRDISIDPDGTIWIATGRGFCRLAGDIRPGQSIVARVYTKKDGLLSEGINDLFRASNGRLWLATTTFGVSEFSPEARADGSHFTNYTRDHGINDSGITSIAEDHDGNLWIGGESGGVMKITRRGFTSYSEADGLEHARIAALGEDRNGAFFVVTTSLKTSSFHIHRFDGRRFENTRVNLPNHVAPSWGWNQLFLHDQTMQWWVPTNNGLFQFPPSISIADLGRVRPLRTYTSQNGLSGREPFRLYQDSRGDVWISVIESAANSYLNRWERATGKFYSYGQEISSRADSAATAFQEDRQGNLWIGFFWGGLVRYRDGKFQLFTKADGVPAGLIRALHLDRLGRLWIASTEGGLARMDDPTKDRPTFVHYTVKDGLSSDQITCITEDQWGRIYAGTGIGVDRLDPDSGRVTRYTVADGLPNSFVNVAYRDRDNALWFGTLQGLSKFVPAIEEQSAAPPILIQHVRVAGSELPVSELGATHLDDLSLPASKNQLEIKFVSLGFRSGNVLRYQFMLEGADRDWSAPTNQRIVNYANLSPGSYRFRVRAVNTDGIVSNEPASVSFTIVPPIWRRWWFIALVIVGLIAEFHFIYRARTRRLIELERVRTRIATDLHDDIGSNLSKIAILSDVTRRKLAKLGESPIAAPLGQIADTSRDCVDAMSDIVWAVNPHRDSLSDLVQRMRRFAEDLLDAKDIEFTIRSSMEDKEIHLAADLRREVYLIFKECINNLVRHSACTKAELAFSISGPWLMISINDNGKGLQPGSNGNSGRVGGHGLKSMQRRAKAIGGSLTIESDQTSGTSITLKVPMRQGSRWRRWPFTYPNGR